jgi:hypothetical protein
VAQASAQNGRRGERRGANAAACLTPVASRPFPKGFFLAKNMAVGLDKKYFRRRPKPVGRNSSKIGRAVWQNKRRVRGAWLETQLSVCHRQANPLNPHP